MSDFCPKCKGFLETKNVKYDYKTVRCISCGYQFYKPVYFEEPYIIKENKKNIGILKTENNFKIMIFDKIKNQWFYFGEYSLKTYAEKILKKLIK